MTHTFCAEGCILFMGCITTRPVRCIYMQLDLERGWRPSGWTGFGLYWLDKAGFECVLDELDWADEA